MISIDASSIDRSLPVPVGAQLYGLLSYALAFGEARRGTRLKSVRQMASDVGVAPMTVSQVYQRLREAGLIEMRPGLGVFAATPPQPKRNDAPATALRGDIEALIGKAERMGVSTHALLSMVGAQASLRKPKPGLDIVFVAIFERPGQDYVDEIRSALGPADRIRMLTVDALKASSEARRICEDADVALTFLHREAEIRALVPKARALALRFVPSAKTRMALAALDPRMRVAAVTYFEDYIAIMKPSIREFAPHVADITTTWASAPDLAEILAVSDAVVYASGADHVAGLAPRSATCIEYRHAPDPGALDNVLAPYLSELRRSKSAAPAVVAA